MPEAARADQDFASLELLLVLPCFETKEVIGSPLTP